MEEGKRLRDRPFWKRKNLQEGGRERKRWQKKDTKVGRYYVKALALFLLSGPVLKFLHKKTEKARRHACHAGAHTSPVC